MKSTRKKRRLLSAERENLILREMGEEARTISELGRILDVSEATVRRDLSNLENRGLLRRIHGGAVREKVLRSEPVFAEKQEVMPEEKKLVAEAALGLIDDGDEIYIDGGSTLLILAKMLGRRKNLTIVTNSIMAAAGLMETGHRLIITGGEFRALSRTLVGVLTDPVIERIHIGKAFMGTIGFSLEQGMTTTDPAEAHTKEIVMKRSGKVVLLADSSKLGLSSFAASGKVSDIDILVTDRGVSAKFAKALRKKGVKIIVTEKEAR